MALVCGAILNYVYGKGFAVMKKLIKRYFWDAIAVLLGAVVAYFMWLIMFGG